MRDYLEQLAGSGWRGQQWAQFEERCLGSQAKLEGWQFNRDEASDEPLKQRAAIALLKSLFLDGQGVQSTQVLQAKSSGLKA